MRILLFSRWFVRPARREIGQQHPQSLKKKTRLFGFFFCVKNLFLFFLDSPFFPMGVCSTCRPSQNEKGSETVFSETVSNSESKCLSRLQVNNTFEIGPMTFEKR